MTNTPPKIDALQAQIAANPGDVHALNRLGIAWMEAGDAGQSLAYFLRAIEVLETAPQNTYRDALALPLYRNAHEVAMRLGRAEVVYHVLQQILALAPDDLNARSLCHRYGRTVIGHGVQALEEKSDCFITNHMRPKLAQNYGLLADMTPREKIGIVLQGPLLAEYDFTLQTVLLYRRIFPYAVVVISTWDDSPADALAALRAAGAHIVANAKPAFAGVGNVNMQLLSAHAGVAYATQSQGCDYVLKSRTDYRIYNQRFFVDALNLLATFPLKKDLAEKQTQRLMGFDDMNLYRIYTVHDRNMFGTAQDMQAYWSAPLDMRDSQEKSATPMELARFGVAESYFLTQYMRLLERPLHWSLQDYWDILKDHFIFMDHAAADMYWCKHARHTEYRMRQYAFDSNFANLGFLEWLRLYQGQYPFVGDARISERASGAPIFDVLSEAAAP